MLLLSLASERSPCRTWISTSGWLSTAVVKISLFFVGIVVLASMRRVMTPPIVSIPSERGVTSRRRTSLISPVRTPPWIAAPTATTSSGLTPLEGALPKIFSTISWIAGIRVEPPTRITSSISLLERPASRSAASQGATQAWMRRSASCSNFARVSVRTRCLGTPPTGMM